MEEGEKHDLYESVMKLQSSKCSVSEGNMEEHEKHDMGESGMDLQSRKCCMREGNMEEDEEHNVDASIMELKHSVKTGLSENTRPNSYIGMGSECSSLESHHLDGVEKDGLTDIWREMAMALEYSKVLHPQL